MKFTPFILLFLAGMLPSIGQQKNSNNNFSSLSAHWNFDEARDWHNMPYPYTTPVKQAKDYAGNNPLLLNKNLDAVNCWASGKQYSAIRFDAKGQFLRATKPLDELKGTCTLSYWIKTNTSGSDSLPAAPSIIGDNKGIIWGAIGEDGKLFISEEGKNILISKSPVNDDQWHHIVILRHAESGNISLFIDGEKSAQGKTTPGELPGEYLGFGMAKGTAPFQGTLDQIHIFTSLISQENIKTLNDNHAPKAYPLETLMAKNSPSTTGSILHLYTFDPDQDPLKVSRFGQPKNGTVTYNNDGTFLYSPSPAFSKEDRFPVTLTDGKGGFCETIMILKDETSIPKPPVTKYSLVQELPSPPEENGKSNHRTPVLMDWNKDGKIDILTASNNRIWVYLNESTRQKISFATPTLVSLPGESSKADITSISYIPANKKETPALVARTKDGLLNIYKVSPNRNGATLTFTGKIQNTDNSDFHCPANAFAFGDYDNDGKFDLLVGDGGGIYLHKNEGTLSKPQFTAERLQVISNSYNLAPYFADLNGDGKMDLIHGINWGSIHYYMQTGGKDLVETTAKGEILLVDQQGKTPMRGDNTILRAMNGTFGAFSDINGDNIPDMILGGYSDETLLVALGANPNAARNNLALIERIYKKHPRNLGQALEANDRELLNLYKNLNREWILWATSLPSIEAREQAYQDLKAHIRRFDFLKRKTLDAWVKKDKETGTEEIGPMHHVPGIFTMNWVTLHCLKPDSAKHRLDVANTLGLKGLDREQYLKSGVAIADNNKCTDGQLLSITDMMKYHPRVMFPDDHLSIDQHFGDGREAMSYVFRSNKNTFGNDVGGAACEMADDLTEPARKVLGENSTTGDYFTLVMAHEVCHSLDAYVRERANQTLERRWADMVVFAGNNGGENMILAQNDKAWVDWEKTQEIFKEKNLWDGDSDWRSAWEDYWRNCEYKDLSFMRGNIGWFIDARQETLATQANHHWAGSESRLVGAISRYNRGYKSNIYEVVLYLDFLSGGLNKIPMYNFEVTQNPNRVTYKVDKAWLERNDSGYITKVTIGPRVYEFEVDETGRVTGIKSHPFPGQL